MKTLFIEAYSKQDLLPAVKANINALSKYQIIGLCTTVQYIKQLRRIKQFLEEHNKRVILTKSSKSLADSQGIKATYAGQVLGCDVPKARNIDCYLYLGTGEFHPVGIAISTNKPVLKLNPFSKKIERISASQIKKILAKKAAGLSKLRTAKKIGIILSTKPGQYKPALASKVKKQLEARGKQVFLFIGNTITSQDLISFTDIECWVNTACPRLVEDIWPKPMVNASDLKSLP